MLLLSCQLSVAKKKNRKKIKKNRKTVENVLNDNREYNFYSLTKTSREMSDRSQQNTRAERTNCSAIYFYTKQTRPRTQIRECLPYIHIYRRFWPPICACVCLFIDTYWSFARARAREREERQIGEKCPLNSLSAVAVISRNTFITTKEHTCEYWQKDRRGTRREIRPN